MTERERLIELILRCDKENEIFDCYKERPRKIQSAELLADHLLSNGVIAPPVKVGGIVYAVTLNTETFTYGIHRGYISCIDIRQTGEYIIVRHEGLDDEPYFDKIVGRFDDFGKTVFLSREEAEKALKEKKG